MKNYIGYTFTIGVTEFRILNVDNFGTTEHCGCYCISTGQACWVPSFLVKNYELTAP